VAAGRALALGPWFARVLASMLPGMRGLNAIGWLAVSILVASNVGACAGSDEDVAAQFAEECTGECDEGLVCNSRVCTAQCTTMTECTPLHPTAICDNGYCFVPCTTSFNCPNGLACTQLQQSMRMTCRAQP
jgi:hypothetical protein